MQFFLQFGYGMMGHSRELVERWGSGAVILSPRDLNGEQLERLGSELTDLNAEVLVDPQLYLPNAYHARLSQHHFWPSEYNSGDFWTGPELAAMLQALAQLNRGAGAERLILPGILASRIDESWISTLELTLECAENLRGEFALVGTLALTSEAMQSQDGIGDLIERAENWDLDAVYIVCQHPNGDYFVADPVWLANLLDLTAGLRLQGKKVILGYCQHQFLIAACAKATAIASGTWMNVRSFPPDKFETKYDEEIKQRAIWYYCPQALSEYKLVFLDMAQRAGLLNSMRPAENLRDFAHALFSGPQPTTVGFTEQQAFRHYLESLRFQVGISEHATFDATVAHHEQILNDAESILSQLNAAGVNGQGRDFGRLDIVSVNRAALADLVRLRGAVLRREWGNI